ncbi:hypothetical protein JAAARDRAFT_143773 [Jaapia argillacea MUCL 33604]|uniref:Uncharacterized protein n=1 Tax=Jaapia argillacea MUCL 33604 TaxID=933084 RepID=A0A067PDR0_9AGAM|nr:hypothetical protein JAAARDRAFT_143773 [Jaapia argillacea MUCL 33604]
MHQERIRSNPCWRGEHPQRDTIFILLDSEQPGMHGMVIGHVYLFFSFVFDDTKYSCALVHWLVPVVKDDDTGMWVARPEFTGNGRPSLAVIHLDSVEWAAHLIGVYGSGFLPADFFHEDTLDVFGAFYVSKYADHHMHEFFDY